MKSSILKLLKKHKPEFISGEEISSTLEVSRTAIWKHIKSLREDGYNIESHPRVGYRLLSVPDRLYPDEINSLLDSKVVGNSVIYLQKTGSTNEVAKEMASAGIPEGAIIVAEEQTSGRGRLGRPWYSPVGKGIWLSIILRPDINPLDAPKLTLVTAVAMARAFNKVGIKAGIKWPNDLLINGKKVAGVLTEMNGEMDRINFVVIGIGININTQLDEMPEELRNIATSLYIETKKSWDRVEFLVNLLKELEEAYFQFKEGSFLNLMEEWKAHSVTLNKPVKVAIQGTYVEGLAIDLDKEGALIINDKEGKTQKVMAGEIVGW